MRYFTYFIFGIVFKIVAVAAKINSVIKMKILYLRHIPCNNRKMKQKTRKYEPCSNQIFLMVIVLATKVCMCIKTVFKNILVESISLYSQDKLVYFWLDMRF